MFEMGINLHKYMQNYISIRRRRRGSNGKLENSIEFEVISTAPANIGWGIGNINVLNQKARYWYVVNYGKMVGGQPYIPNKGNFVPGSFEGNRPESSLKGGVQKFNFNDGSNFGMNPKSIIRPLNYISATRARFNTKLRSLMRKFRGIN